MGLPGLKGDQGPEVRLCVYLWGAVPFRVGQTLMSKNVLNTR